MDDVTFVIKTFMRPYCVFRLVRSIYKYYPDAIILIGDDSERSCRSGIKRRFPKKKITVYELPFNCGVSYGRNFLVNRVETEYFVLLDDDMVFDDKTDIEHGRSVLREKGLDICGGFFRNYPALYHRVTMPLLFLKQIQQKNWRGIPTNHMGFLEYADRTLRVRYYNNRFPEYEKVDAVPNFFIARTSVLREKCLWDEALKIHEHTAFFIKAKKRGLQVGFDGKMSVQHKPVLTKEYRKYRNQERMPYVREWMRLCEVDRVISTMNDGEEIVVTR